MNSANLLYNVYLKIHKICGVLHANLCVVESASTGLYLHNNPSQTIHKLEAQVTYDGVLSRCVLNIRNRVIGSESQKNN